VVEFIQGVGDKADLLALNAATGKKKCETTSFAFPQGPSSAKPTEIIPPVGK
jgi:hypothetical protein